jgi:hypothetical protein
MNITESKAVFDLLDALGGEVDTADYHRKVELAVEAVVFLTERARKCLGAGPDVNTVLRRIADAGSMAHNAARTFVPIADECEDYLFWREQADESQAAIDQAVAR